MNTDINNLEINHTYLIKYGISDGLYQIKILKVSEKAYFIEWGCNDKNRKDWEEKKTVSKKYQIIEDITQYVSEQ